MDLYDPGKLNSALRRHGFRFSKRLGQNFLISEDTARQIAEQAADGPGAGVMEVGPGAGSLTVQLAPLYDKVVCVELDGTLLPLLEESLADAENVRVVRGNILKLDIPALVREQLEGLTPVVCANLPYNITGPVVSTLLRADCFQRITVMVQKEVGRRMCAEPGGRDYGSFSLLCRYYADCRVLFDVPPSCFLPRPKVTSSVVRMEPRPRPAEVADEKAFFRVVRAAFGQRRKTLANALASGLSDIHGKDEILAAIETCGLPEDIRGERLDLPAFAELARVLFPDGCP